MIRKITINDLKRFNELGTILNSNFSKVYNLEALLKEDYNKIYVYEINNNIIGFAHFTISFEVSDLVNIVIDDKYRNHGFGKELINNFINENNIKEINIEVNENNNNAIEFYKKLNFKEIRRIKNYYESEDALLMKLVII